MRTRTTHVVRHASGLERLRERLQHVFFESNRCDTRAVANANFDPCHLFDVHSLSFEQFLGITSGEAHERPVRIGVWNPLSVACSVNGMIEEPLPLKARVGISDHKIHPQSL